MNASYRSLAALLAAACSSGTDAFPRSFLFGTAVAGFQVDMGCPTLPAAECEDPASDWYRFVTAPETVNDPAALLSGDPPSAGPGHWELYEHDFDLAARELKNDAFRLSIEWSRVFPRATDAAQGYDALKALASAPALAKYHAMFAALKARGLKPLVTLNHYTLPAWIHDTVGCHQDLASCSPRGWVDKDRTVREIAKYAGFVAREFGGEVDLWVTLNEAFSSIAIAGYLFQTEIRSNPPAVRFRYDEAKTVYHALVEAHARMYDAVKQNDLADADGDGTPAAVGLVHPMVPFAPKDPAKPFDVRAAENVHYLWNLAFLNATAKGDFDANLDGTKVRRADLAGRMDFVGINYYQRARLEGIEGPAFPQLSPLTTFNPLTFEANETYPRGLYEMILVVKGMGLPVYVTENGVKFDGDEETQPRYLVQHLAEVRRAMRAGADVRGYFVWTLMDNYEWHLGMSFPMGLYAVDKTDPEKRRRARKYATVYGQIAAGKRIPPELKKQYGVVD